MRPSRLYMLVLVLLALSLGAVRLVTAAGTPGRHRADPALTVRQTAAPERVVAFRGYSAVAPENTLAAVHAAVAAGVPRVWAEARTTSDNVPVLLADETLDRTTDCTGPVRLRAAAAVSACDAGAWFDPSFAGERVPTLAAALAEPGVAYQLSLVELDPAPVLAAVRAAGALGRVTFVSEVEAVVTALKAAEPGATVWYRSPYLSPRVVDLAVQLGADGLAVNDGTYTDADVAAATAAGLALGVAGVTDEARLATLLRQGVTSAAMDRVEPAIWALGLQFRTYLPADLGRPMLGQQGFVRTLAPGDFNGDGRVDLAVGAPLDDSAAESGGWAGVVLGAARFPGPVQGQPGTEDDGQWGSVFAAADFNADKFDDLALGYPQRDFNGTDAGAVWLWDGAPAGVGGLSRPIGGTAPGGSHMGAALAAGDFNGDGVADLAIGSPDRAVNNVASSGQVTVMPGLRGSGPVATGALVLDRTTTQKEPAVSVPGDPVRSERLGAALAAGDFDGDGVTDLALGVPGADDGDARAAGSVLVAFGAAAKTTGYPALKRVVEVNRSTAGVPGDPERNSGFGSVLAAADFDGDGRDELVIAAPDATVSNQRGAGEVVVLYGAAGGFDPARGQAINQDSGAVPGQAENRVRFGDQLATGDLDGDGHPDLAIGVPDAAREGQPGVGTAIVVYGGPAGLRPRVAMGLVPSSALTGFAAAPRQAFGRSLAVADLNHDGAMDLALGMPGYAAGGVTDLGALVVAWGPHPGLPGVATATVPPATATPEPTITRTPRPTRTQPPSATPTITTTPTASGTPRPVRPIHLPFAVRVMRFPHNSGLAR
jgi:glycerophosphoryl diester phosphodiesterase